MFDPKQSYTVDPESFLTMGRATPFAGIEVFGQCLLTVCDGRIVWRDKSVQTMPAEL